MANKETGDSVFSVADVATELFGRWTGGNEGDAKFLFIVLYKD